MAPDEPVTLINAFEVSPEDANRFLAAWENVRDYLETQPGYIDGLASRPTPPPARC
jgi:heme-degrading monooxygenase HmoA